MDTISKFESITNFAAVYEAIQNEKSNRKRGNLSEAFYLDTCGKVLGLVDAEIESKLGEPWRDLKKINDSFVAIHTILVLWRVMIDPMFQTYSQLEQNILKWGALLHDIRKLGPPVYEGKDHIHPFKSAQSVI